MKRFFIRIWPWLRNKYVLTLTVFAIWMLFFDQNNLVDRIQLWGMDMCRYRIHRAQSPPAAHAAPGETGLR